eukprot:scaffold650725_cov56-Prasinocladus_malaysianus.AAC.1
MVLVFLTKLQPELLDDDVDFADVHGTLARAEDNNYASGDAQFLPENMQAFWEGKLHRKPSKFRSFKRGIRIIQSLLFSSTSTLLKGLGLSWSLLVTDVVVDVVVVGPCIVALAICLRRRAISCGAIDGAPIFNRGVKYVSHVVSRAKLSRCRPTVLADAVLVIVGKPMASINLQWILTGKWDTSESQVKQQCEARRFRIPYILRPGEAGFLKPLVKSDVPAA